MYEWKLRGRIIRKTAEVVTYGIVITALAFVGALLLRGAETLLGASEVSMPIAESTNGPVRIDQVWRLKGTRHLFRVKNIDDGWIVTELLSDPGGGWGLSLGHFEDTFVRVGENEPVGVEER